MGGLAAVVTLVTRSWSLAVGRRSLAKTAYAKCLNNQRQIRRHGSTRIYADQEPRETDPWKSVLIRGRSLFSLHGIELGWPSRQPLDSFCGRGMRGKKTGEAHA